MCCNYSLKISILLANYNNYIIHLKNKYSDDIEFINQFNTIDNNIKCNNNCKFLYNTLKVLYYLLKRKYTIHIKCYNNCVICHNSKYKLKFIPNNYKTSTFIMDQNIPYNIKQKKYDIISDQIINKLQNNNIPIDIINNDILSYNTLFKCEFKKNLLYTFQNLFKYNFNMNILLKNKKFIKYFKLDKICQFTNNCQNCKLLNNMITDIFYIIEFKNIKYTSCDMSYGFEPLYDYGFNYFIYNYTKFITLDDYSIIPMLIEHDWYEDTYGGYDGYMEYIHGI